MSLTRQLSSPLANEVTFSSESDSDVEVQQPKTVNIDDDKDFPALGPTAKPLVFATPAAWNKPKPGKSSANVGGATEVLDILTNFQERLDKKAIADIVKQVASQVDGLQVEQSHSRTGTLTFVIRGKSREDVALGRRLLASKCCVKTTFKMPVPVSAKSKIIGSAGKNLKALTAKTMVKIDIGRESRVDEDEEEVSDITISGDADGIEMARKEIQAVVDELASRSQITIQTAKRYRPFLIQQVPRLQQDFGITIHVPRFEGSGDADGILLVGSKESVRSAQQEINQLNQSWATMQTIMITLPKAKHRFLVGPKGQTLQEILAQTGCAVEIPAQGSESDQVIVHGPQARLLEGLTAVLDRANSQHIATFDLRSLVPPQTNIQHLLKYISMKERGNIRNLESSMEGVDVKNVTQPEWEVAAKSQEALDKALAGLKSIVEPVAKQYRFGVVEVPQALHKHIIGKGGQGLPRIRSKIDGALGDDGAFVDLVLPYRDEDGSDADGADEIIFVVKPASAKVDAKGLLAKAKQEMDGIVKEIADLSTATLNVDKKFHSRLIGHGAATLKEFLAPYEGQVSIRIPPAKETPQKDGDPNVVTVRGPKEKVEDCLRRLKEKVDELKHQDIMCSFNDTVSLPKGIGKRLMGTRGDMGWLYPAVKEKLASEKSKVEVTDRDVSLTRVELNASDKGDVISLTGHKRVVELAKAIIQERGNKVADTTSIQVTIPPEYHARLIGKGGKQLIKLMDRYSVHIKFPGKSDDDKEPGTDDNKIVIRGGTSDVEKTKQELLDLVEWEKAQSFRMTFSVPDAAVAKILGKGGQTINGIKDDLQCRIDIGRRSEDKSPVEFVITGNQKDAEECRQRIMSIVEDITGAASKTMPLARSQHKFLIGPGGVTIRNFVSDLASEFDVSEDLIRINVSREETDEVQVKAPGKIIDKVIQRIQDKFGSSIDLKDAVTIEFVIPKADVARIVGKGGETVRALSTKHTVDIKIDKKRSEKDDETFVQVTGSAAAVEEAKTDILSKVRASAVIPVAHKRMIAHLHGDASVQKVLRDHGVSLESAGMAVSLHGDPASVGKTQSLIAAHAKSLEEYAHHEEVEVPAVHRARISNRSLLQGISKKADARLDFGRGKDDKLHVSAKTPEGLQTAKQALTEELSKQAPVTREMRIPSRLHGQIIGPQGSGLRELESKVGKGVNIKFPPRGNTEVAITGPADLVDKMISVLEQRIGGLTVNAPARVDSHAQHAQNDSPELTQKASKPPGYSGSMANKTAPVPSQETFAPVHGVPDDEPRKPQTWKTVETSSVKKFKEKKLQQDHPTGVVGTNGFDALQ